MGRPPHCCAFITYRMVVRPGRSRVGPHREEHSGAAIGCTLDPHVPLVTLDDALHGREPDAGALELLLRMHALKRREQFPGVAHVEARTVVAHEIDAAALAAFRPDLDQRVRTLCGG